MCCARVCVLPCGSRTLGALAELRAAYAESAAVPVAAAALAGVATDAAALVVDAAAAEALTVARSLLCLLRNLSFHCSAARQLANEGTLAHVCAALARLQHDVDTQRLGALRLRCDNARV